jgi:beta-1,4-N-acetylglucosaminyltransferase
VTGEDGSPQVGHLPAVYFLYVLGSGGHTTEMCEMIKNQFRASANLHRRYLVTRGDFHSPKEIAKLESIIKDACPDDRAGTWDGFVVTRARMVHQSYFTAIATTIWSGINIVNALTREPYMRPFKQFGNLYKFPHVIVTNGPGTGFVVCLVAHLLRIFCLVPQDRLKMVYVESWARIDTLSLTGKLLYWTKLADLFVVQHESLGKKLSLPYASLVFPNTKPAG